MLRRWRWMMVLLLVLSAVQSATAALRDDVDRLIRGASLKGATIAVSIRDSDTNAELIEINPDLPMAPASNMKLLTSGAALCALGPNFEFTTKLLRQGDRLIVVGDGDPAFGDPDLLPDMSLNGTRGVDVEAFLDVWVKPVVNSGMKHVSQVIVDDRVFDRDFVHTTWPADQLNNRYCAQVGGLNFHANVLHFYPRPRPGQPPSISECRPRAPWLKVANSATSRDSAKDKNDAWIARKPGTNDLTMRGNARFAYKVPVPVTVHDMPEFFSHILADRLMAAGVSVDQWRASQKDDPISQGDVIGPIVTTPISTVIKRCNTDSENLYAECLLKRIGRAMTGEPGSWTNGSAIIRHIMHQRLDDPALVSGVIIADGSGLSAENRITASCMTAWLNNLANDSAIGPVFLESLAVAGESGTLQKRYGDTRKLHGATVQAKTGYINKVSCLSGYITMPNGKRRSFSILVNGLRDGTVSAAKQLQDQIVSAVAQDMAQAPVALGSD